MAGYTQADLDRVNRLIAQPLTVESGGERMTNHNLAQLRALKREIEEDLARRAGTRVHRVSYLRFGRD